MLGHYLRLSLAVLARRKFFTAISIFGTSFTLMVLMVATAMLDHTFGPGRPELKMDRILILGHLAMRGPNMRSNGNAGYQLLDRYARNLPGAERMSFFSGTLDSRLPVFVDGRKLEPIVKKTDAEFWQILDFTFLEGRPFTHAEFESRRRVAVLNQSTRQQVFGNATALGRPIEIAGDRYEVIGVVENVSMLRVEPFSDIWLPYSTEASTAYRSQLRGEWTALALVRDAAGWTALREEFNSRLVRADMPPGIDQMVAPFETRFERLARDSPFSDELDPESQARRLQLFFGVVALLFLMIPVVNLVNLNVSRIMERSSEIGVRKAFGAPATTLVGQFVVENVILTLAGGALGLILSAVVLKAINDSGAIPYSQLAVNLRIFGWAFVLSVLFGVLTGAYPAWRMSRLHPVQALKGAAL